VSPGVLSAVQIGSQVLLSMTYADVFRHCFTVERLFIDSGGGETWVPVSGCKYVKIGTAYDTAIPSGGTVTYRALAYDLLEHPNVLQTDGVYTEPVSITITKWDDTHY
jgi:hypothetical protein